MLVTSRRAVCTAYAGVAVVTVLVGCGPEAPLSGADVPDAQQVEALVTKPPPGNVGVPCSLTPKLFVTAVLQERENWYGRQISAAGEGNLCGYATDSTEVYRFTWLRTFHPAVIVRLERRGGEIQLYAKQLTGAGGYDPGALATHRVVSLTSGQWHNFRVLLERVAFWSEITSEKDPALGGLDGAQWILEGAHGDRYRALDRWSPDEKAPIRQLGVFLLELGAMLPSDPELVY